MEKTEQKQSINTPPKVSFELQILGKSRHEVEVHMWIDELEHRDITLKTHMLYEALEVYIGNAMRPLINKFLEQIREHYTY